MKLNFRMPDELKSFYQKEIETYHRALADLDYPKAWHHLERAHIIGQRYAWPHTETHSYMLYLGFRQKKVKEVLGQALRLILGAPFSLIGQIPVGNVGSTRVSMIKRQRIPTDIQAMFSKTNNLNGNFRELR
ncbi:DUF3703 domain-containing protein [Reichenbachiella carrageenanivorans]|uniref:DUF3703 domain-containing protein n=1 Tax=Reichenbachiella carrageenanivorans TaxID=2979869 RepID=A0ABY6D2J2_9BACT|nr:DUF3703 domain-containing protein [Reichenbachiella carrageenanivorans]UXX80382.1 DUF3703 domain-containing protein [Reichenbachiella carrageenanivorans]